MFGKKKTEEIPEEAGKETTQVASEVATEESTEAEKAEDTSADHDTDKKEDLADRKREKKEAKKRLKEAKKDVKRSKKELRRAEKAARAETPEQKARRKKAGKAAFFFLVFLCLLLALLYFFVWPVKQSKTEVTLELGDSLSENPEDYLKGNSVSLLFCSVDLSGVDQEAVGEYTMTCEHGRQNFVYMVHVVDTTAPTVNARSDSIYLAVGQEYELTSLVEDAYDASGTISYSYENLNLMVPMTYEPKEEKASEDEEKEEKKDASGDASPRPTTHDSFTVEEIREEPSAAAEEMGEKNTKLQIMTPGVYSADLLARDPSGNATKSKVVFTVDTAPEISGFVESFVTAGSRNVVVSQASAYDDLDGDLTKKIQFDEGAIDWSKKGDYVTSASVTDSFGLTTEVEAVIHVMDAEEIDALLSLREINREEQFVYGANNMYTAGTAKMDFLEDQEDYMLPTAVRIHMLNAAQTAGNYGSGFIIYMDEDSVYICSNAHVLKYWDQNSKVYFFDGSACNRGEIVGSDEDEDIAFLKIKTADIDEETLEKLMAVQLDLDMYRQSVDGGTTVFMEIIGVDGFEYVREGETRTLTDCFGLVVSKTLETTVTSVAGNSGSALLNSEGALIAMNVGYHFENGVKTYVSIRADLIAADFEKICKEPIYIRNAD